MQLLLVEDNLDHAKLFEFQIKGANHDYPRMEVKVCHSLTEAKEALSEHKYHLVLLDIYLPDTTELQGLKLLSGMYPDIPIVIYSSYYSQELASEAIALGAQDYIIKGTLGSEDLVRTLFHAKLRQDNMLKLRLIGERH